MSHAHLAASSFHRRASGGEPAGQYLTGERARLGDCFRCPLGDDAAAVGAGAGPRSMIQS